MIRYLSLNRNLFYSILFTVAMLFAGLGTLNAQSPCGNVSTSLVFPNSGCEHEFVAANYIEVSTASDVFVQQWEYSYDGGTTFTAIPGSGGNHILPFNLLNLVDGGPQGVVFRLKYNAGCAFGYSNNSGAYSIIPRPVAATTITGPTSVCSGATNTYAFSGANFLLVSPPALWTTSYSITTTVTGGAAAGTPTFTRLTNTTGTLSINPTNAGPTIGTAKYEVYATNGTCAAVLIGTVGPVCVYPVVSGGSLSSTLTTICTGTAITLSLPGFTNLVALSGSCGGTTYSLSSNAGTLTGTCGTVTDGISGSFTTGSTPGTVSATPTNTTNVTQTITYSVTITNGPCADVTRTVNVTVLPKVTGGAIASGTSTICSGSTVTNSVSGITCANGHSAATSYTISVFSPGANLATQGLPVTTTQTGSAVFTVNPTNTGCLNTGNIVTYEITATNGTCAPFSLGTFAVTVVPALNATGVTVTSPLAPTNTLCTGSGTTITVNGLGCSTGYGSGFTSITVSAPTLSSGVTGGAASSVTNNASTATFTIGALNLAGCTSGTATYNITGQNSPCSSISLGSITITIIPNVTAGTVGGTATICNGGSTSNTISGNICANGHGALTTYTISVQSSGANIATTGLPGSTTNTTGIFSVNPTATSCTSTLNTVTYQVTATNGSPCSAFSLGTFTVTVIPPVTAGSTVGTKTICTGSSTTNTSLLTGITCANGHSAATTYTLSFVSSTGSIATNGLPGTLTNNTGSFSVNPTNTSCNTGSSVTYNITANNGIQCTSFNLGNFTVNVDPSPVVNGQTFSISSGVSILCASGSTTITPANVCAGATYFWEVNIDGGGFNPVIPNTQGALSTGTLASNACASRSYVYRLTISIGSCSAQATATPIVVYPTIVATTNVGVSTACAASAGGSFNFSTSSISCEQAGAKYELLLDGTPIITNTTSQASFLAAITSIAAPSNYTCAPVAHTYSIRVTNTPAFAGCTTTSSTVSVTVNPSPASVNTGLGLVVSVGTSICTGDKATLSVNACAGATPGTWLVQVNGAGGFVDISTVVPAITMTPLGGGLYQTNGLTTPVFPACTQTTYQFRNTFTLGGCSETTTSSNLVTVFPAPTASTITINAASTGTITGSNIDICTAVNTVVMNSTVPACGTITKWEYSLNGGLTWQSISASASNNLTVTNVPQNTLYRAVISNGALCATTTSNVLSATVNVVNGGAANASVNPLCNGSSTNITVTGQLGNIIDWQSAPTSGFVTITSLATTSNPINVSPVTNLWYRAVLASGVCTTFSAPVLITVNPATVGGTIANGAAATQCSPASGTLTLSGHTGTVQQWEYSINNGATWTQIANTTATLSYSGVTQTTKYRALVKSGACTEAYSSDITVTVYPVTTPTLTTSGTAICQGSTVDLTSSATNATVGVTTYQITSTGATVATIYATSTTPPPIQTLTPAVGSTNYILTVTTAPCGPQTSTVTVVTSATTVSGSISGAPALPSTQCAPAAGALSLTGNTGAVQQWEYSIDNGSTWVPVVNTTTSLNYSGLTQTTLYRALVKSGVCSAAYTSAVTITVYPTPSASINSNGTAICQGTGVNLTSSASNVVAGVTTYQITSTGATVATIYGPSTTAPGVQTITPAVGTTNYILTVTTSPCSPVTSTVTVVTSPTTVPGSLTPATSAVCVTGNSGTITLSGQTGTVQQWEYSEDAGNTWNVITNTTTSQNYSNLLITTQYRTLVKSGNCSAAYSAISVITVYKVPTVTLNSGNATICNGTGGTTITGSATNTVATVTTYTITAAPGGTLYASSTTAPTFPFPVNPGVTTTYTYTVTTAPCSAVSTSTTVNVIQVPTATLSASSPICAIAPTVLAFTNSNVTPGLTTYLITSDYPTAGSEVYATNTTAPNSPLTVDATNINPNGTTTYTYTVVSAPCAAVTVTKTVVVHPVPTVTLTAAAASICNGLSTTISGTATPVVPTVTSYKIGTTSGGSDVYSSSTTAPTFPLTVSPTATTTYYYSVTNGSCNPVIASTTVTVIPVPTATITSPSPICATTSTVLTLSTTNTVAGLTTYKITSDYPSAGSVVYATNTTAPNSPFTVNATYVNPNGVTNYTYTIGSTPCTDVTASVPVTVRPVPTAGLTSAAASICNGTSTTITGSSSNTVSGVTLYTITAAPGGILYASSTTAPTFPFSVTPSTTTTYTYTVTNGPCAPVNATTTVVVIPVPTATITSPTPICATSSVVLSLSTTLTTPGLTTYKITSDYPTAGSVVYATNTTEPNATLTVPATYVNPNGVTNYTYAVTSAPCGAVTVSTPVTVHPVPVVSISAAAASICNGTSTTITGTASPVVSGVTTYKIGTTSGGFDIYGTTAAGLTTAPGTITVSPTTTTTYFYSVTNGACSPVISSVTVVVIPQPVITSFTSTATICATTSTVLTFGTSSTLAGLTTYKVTSNYPTAGSEVYASNTTAPTSPLTVDPTNVNPNGATIYTYTVTSAPCASTTATFTQTVYPVPTVTLTSAASSICNGTSTTLSGTATPVVGTVTTYKIGTTSGGFNIYGGSAAGSTTAPTFPLSVSPTTTTTYFYSVTNGVCSPVVASVTVVVIPQPVISSFTATSPICATTSTVLTFTTSSTVAGLTTYKITSDYPTAGSEVYATNTTSPTSPLTVDPTNVNPNGTTNYTYTVTSAPCGSTTSTTSVTVYPVPTVTLTATDASICNGSSTTLNGTAGPVVPGVTTYKIGTTPGGFDIYGTTTTGLTTAPTFPLTVSPTTTKTYYYTVTNGVCSPVSANVTVTVIPVPTASVTSPSPICATSSVVLTLASTNTVSGLTTYKITSDYPSAGSIVYSTNTSAPNTPLTVPSTYVKPKEVTTFTYIVTSAPCTSVTSSISVIVYPVPTVTLNSADQSICNGTSTTLTGTSIDTVSGVSTFIITAAPGGVIYASSTTAPTFPLTVSPVVTTTYTYTITNSPCSPVSASKTVVVIPQPIINSFSSTTPICATSSTVLTFATSSTVAGLTTYKITSDYPTAGSEVYASNTTPPTSPLTVDATNVNPNGVTTYTYTVLSPPCGATTATFAVTVHPVPVVTLTSANSSICFGSSTTLSGTANPVVGVTTYKIGTTPGGFDVYGTTTSGLPTAPTFPFTVSPTATTTYYYTVMNGACSPVTATVTVTVIPVPTATISSPTPICATSSTVLTLSTTNTVTGLTTYKITSDYPTAGSIVFNTNTSAPNSPLTVPATYVNPNGVTNYSFIVTSAPCASTVASTSVTVHPVPVVTITSAATSICNGSSTTISGTANPVVSGVTTYKIGTTSGGFDIYGTTAAGLVNAPTFPLTVSPSVTTTYYYTVTNGACNPVTASVTIIVIPQPVITSFTSTTPICATTSTVLTFATTNTVAGITTYKITSSYPTAGSEVYASNSTAPSSPLTVDATNVNPNGITTYTYTVTSAPCGATTSTFSVTVHPVPVVTLTAANASICNGSSTTLTGTANPVVSGVTTYKIGTTPGGFDVYGTTTTGLTTAPSFPFSVAPTTTTTYYYTVLNGACSPVTASVLVTVIPVPTASVTATTPICATTSTVLTLNSTNTVAGLTTYKITSDYPSVGSIVFNTNTSAPNSPFTVPSTYVNPNGVTNYTFTVTSAPCTSVSSTFAVTVRPVPAATISLAPNPICLGSTTTLTISVGNVVGGITSYAIGTTAGGTDVVGTTTISTSGTFTTTAIVTPPVGNTTYYLTAITAPCGSVSANTSITVNPTSVGGTLSAGVIICPSSSNSSTFTLTGNVGNVVKWQQSINDGATWTDITNTLTSYTATNIAVSTLYRAVVQSGVCPPANSATSGVFVNTNPVANFTNTTVCFNTPPTVFSNTTSVGTTLNAAQQVLYNIIGTVTTTTTYLWTFGDPSSGAANTSTLTSPTHAYTSSGTFTASLVATTNTLVGATTIASCSNGTSKSVTVNQVTTADYTNSPVCLGSASVLNIVNYNAANVYSVVWGDGTAAQTVTPVVSRTFVNPGQYSVRLKLTNIYGCSDSITKNVTAWALPTTTGVNITNTAPCVGSTITFTPVGDAGGTTFVINPATGIATATVANAATITSYLWDFGDGNTANTRIATNAYALPGTYTIKLTITNSNGCSQTFTFSSTPVTVGPNPVANFSTVTQCLGVANTFTDLSTVASGTITGWAWNFGNPTSGGNNTSTLQNPTHLFTAAGNYTVSLTVTTASPYGCTNTTTKQVTVNPLPLVNFNSSANSACAGSTITFNSTSTITSGSFTYAWRVSDNTGNFNYALATVSANTSLIQTFATAGTYNIRLYGTSSFGCVDSFTRSVVINANPTATIVTNPASAQICIYESITYTSTGSLAGSGVIAGYAWTFGDGSTSTAANPAAKTYASPGTYTVTLTITNSNGCLNTTTKTVTVNPKPVVNFNTSNVCFGYTMNFTDASTTSVGSTYLWNFGDIASGALNTSATQNTSHDFTSAGTYNVKLVVTNNTGCKDSTTKSVTVWPRPVANFKADTACEGHITTFTNLSTIASGSVSFVWYFGDAANSTSISTSPTFIYAPGTYSVKLVVTSGFGCIDSIRKTILVKPNPRPKFIVANACLRDVITLDTTGTNGSASAIIAVNYGDGTPTTALLTHTYAMSGVYTIDVTMTDGGCTAVLSKVVTVYDLPLTSFSASAYSICVNEVDTFSNTSSITSGTIVSNKWEVINSSNTVVSSVTYASNQEFIYAFNTSGIFRVRLTSTSDKGCTDTTTKLVTVNALPTVTINSTNLPQAFHACLGTPHGFTSTGSTAGSGTITGYSWDFGDGSFSSSANPSYTYKSVGTFIVNLTITNSNGCTFSKQQTVVVDPIPDATITASNFPVETCNGSPITLTGPSGNGYTYLWTRNGATIDTRQSITVSPATSGWYFLAVTSGFGCTKVDSVYLTVNPLPVIKFDLGLNVRTVTLSKGWSKQVTALATGPNNTFTYLWTPQDANVKAMISNPVISNPVLTPPNDVTNYYFVVTVTDQKGCVQRDTVFFILLPDFSLKPTNLMTPNDDGKNDFFEIQNIETYDDAEVTIFNRWGNVVYQTKNYASAKWNGTYKNNGGLMPDGTYFYIIKGGENHKDVNGNEIIYKGNITILRGR